MCGPAVSENYGVSEKLKAIDDSAHRDATLRQN